ncbi:hypothetical protein K7X08_022611 [Anisodus acutangulus]|uniref:Uncharacterized protein n=1 Tax=Anisodus acutangulus TaxID=402998 RepID=A0A9Q1ML68_9SOLA|nr:hypothetical protein K7X08_022611 [Anisodus acutangulus]
MPPLNSNPYAVLAEGMGEEEEIREGVEDEVRHENVVSEVPKSTPVTEEGHEAIGSQNVETTEKGLSTKTPVKATPQNTTKEWVQKRFTDEVNAGATKIIDVTATPNQACVEHITEQKEKEAEVGMVGEKPMESIGDKNPLDFADSNKLQHQQLTPLGNDTANLSRNKANCGSTTSASGTQSMLAKKSKGKKQESMQGTKIYLNDETTDQNFKNAARAGDLSPKHIGMMMEKTRKKGGNEQTTSQHPGVKTRRHTDTKSNM